MVLNQPRIPSLELMDSDPWLPPTEIPSSHLLVDGQPTAVKAACILQGALTGSPPPTLYPLQGEKAPSLAQGAHLL